MQLLRLGTAMHATQPLKHEAGEIRIDLTTDLKQTWIPEANLDTRNLLEYKTKIEYKQIRNSKKDMIT